MQRPALLRLELLRLLPVATSRQPDKSHDPSSHIYCDGSRDRDVAPTPLGDLDDLGEFLRPRCNGDCCDGDCGSDSTAPVCGGHPVASKAGLGSRSSDSFSGGRLKAVSSNGLRARSCHLAAGLPLCERVRRYSDGNSSSGRNNGDRCNGDCCNGGCRTGLCCDGEESVVGRGGASVE